MSQANAEQRLAEFLSRYDPEIAALAEDALVTLRELLPGAVEMVYDNFNALVVGFGPSEKASEAILSIGLYPRWVNVYFLYGVGLPDPQRLLKGNGKQVRFLRLEDARTLDKPAVRAIIAQAVKRARRPLDPDQPRTLIIKAMAEKRRSRRPSKP